jgi:hypothetical protein
MEVAESAADLLIYKKKKSVMLLCFYILTSGKNVFSLHSK